MKFFAGLLILGFGLIFLAHNLGLWPGVSASELLNFWPLALILFSITLLSQHLKFGWIIILISFVVALYLIYIVSHNNFNNIFLTIPRLNRSIRL